MTKFRYSISLIISSIIYMALGFLLINFLDAKKTLPKPKKNIIKISVITPIPKIITPPIIIPPKKIKKSKAKPHKAIHKIIKKPKRKKKIIKKKRVKKKKVIKKKVVKKKIIRKKIIKKIIKKVKPKKVIKKHVVKKRVIKKKVLKKRVIKEHVVKKHIMKKEVVKARVVVKPRPMPRPVVQEIYTPPAPVVKKSRPKVVKKPAYIPPPPPPPKVDTSGMKRSFLSQVRSQIIANKKYPKMALRRHIEGSVGVKFDIGTNGNVSNIRFISGKTILQKAVRKAILHSFPIRVPSKLQGELPINNISVTINFSIN